MSTISRNIDHVPAQDVQANQSVKHAKENVQLIECPRDAMQGWPHFIPTQTKIKYLNSLLKVGFHTLDCGSFVSPKAIPQMADSSTVIPALDLSNTATKLLTIVANERGADDAVMFDQITYLGFPFSISETFQIRNANSNMQSAVKRVEYIHNLCIKNKKELVLYISMAFGNPYGDEYSATLVYEWSALFANMGIKIISLADTVGIATASQVKEVTSTVINALPNISIGVHLHSAADSWQQKLDAALAAGCKRIDGAINGIGGCPMAGNELVGNMDTNLMIPYLQHLGVMPDINNASLTESMLMANQIFV